jgi:hypothetical protein
MHTLRRSSSIQSETKVASYGLASGYVVIEEENCGCGYIAVL